VGGIVASNTNVCVCVCVCVVCVVCCVLCVCVVCVCVCVLRSAGMLVQTEEMTSSVEGSCRDWRTRTFVEHMNRKSSAPSVHEQSTVKLPRMRVCV
jgi:hypothetical protein